MKSAQRSIRRRDPRPVPVILFKILQDMLKTDPSGMDCPEFAEQFEKLRAKNEEYNKSTRDMRNG